MLKKGEELQPLGNGVSVIVSKEHHFFTDTILLANFSKPRPNDKAVDLGTGCGTIPLLWNKETIITPTLLKFSKTALIWHSGLYK